MAWAFVPTTSSDKWKRDVNIVDCTWLLPRLYVNDLKKHAERSKQENKLILIVIIIV